MKKENLMSFDANPVESGKHFSLDEVQEYLLTPGVVEWVEARELLAGECDACVDGRTKEPVIANPGGDMAILAQAIISLGEVMDVKYSRLEMGNIFRWYIGKFGSFYMHTDEHGVEHLMKSVNNDSVLGVELSSVEETIEYYQNPPKNHQVRLLSHLTDPNNIGCGHLKLMMTDPGAYGMSRKVLDGLMSAYFDVMWNGTDEEKEKIENVILEGSHNEGAVVVLTVPGEITDGTMIPKVMPTDGKVSVFVNHPQATSYMQKNVALALAESGMFEEVTDDHVDVLMENMDKQLDKEVRTTVSRLGFGLPVYIFEMLYR